jgi:hypothetical protein
MKTLGFGRMLAVGATVYLCGGVALTLAQYARHDAREHAATAGKAVAGPAGDNILRVRKLEGLGKRGYVKSPEFEVRTSLAKGPKPQQDWVQILVDYDTEPKWIDELTFQFYAMAETVEDGKKAYSFYQVTARYGDIERGRSHMAAVYLRPQAVKRYGDLVAIAVEISHEGKVVAELADDAGTKMPPQWWKNPDVIGRKDVTTRAGYLLEKSQSPFALVNIDDFEVTK